MRSEAEIRGVCGLVIEFGRELERNGEDVTSLKIFTQTLAWVIGEGDLSGCDALNELTEIVSSHSRN